MVDHMRSRCGCAFVLSERTKLSGPPSTIVKLRRGLALLPEKPEIMCPDHAILLPC
jgi:hypothetical protein